MTSALPSFSDSPYPPLLHPPHYPNPHPRFGATPTRAQKSLLSGIWGPLGCQGLNFVPYLLQLLSLQFLP